MKNLIVVTIIAITSFAGCTKQIGENNLKGEYIGQPAPGNKAELFAPGVISTGIQNRDIAITPDGNEIYTCAIVGNFNYTKIIVTKNINGSWSKPELASFSRNIRYKDIEPAISPDGSKFYFVSNRPDSASGKFDDNWDIWVMDRIEDGWSDPVNLGAPVNTAANEFFPSVTNSGSIYFNRNDVETREEFIFKSELIDGKYSEAEKLPGNVNCGRARYNAFVSPDESYIIVPVYGMEDSFGGTDYYIVYHNSDDQWSDPINLGEKINSAAGKEWSPYVTRDGKYFFFMSQKLNDSINNEKIDYKFLIDLHNSPENGDTDIYWIKADFIDDLRPDGF